MSFYSTSEGGTETTYSTGSSDSHKKEHLGAYIDETKTMLKDMGFEYLCIFKQMKPEFIEL